MQTRRTVTWLMPLRGLALSRVATGDFGDLIPIRGLSPDELQRFTDRRAAFEEVEEAGDGLGPVFNGTSCVGCHNVGATGGCSEVVETRFGAGAFDSLSEHGGSLIQTDGIGLSDRRVPAGIGPQGACNFVGEVVLAEATIVASRRTTPLFGLGLGDAVPDADLVALANQQKDETPKTAGQTNMVIDITTGEMAVGEFGWKSQLPNLRQFSGDAHLNEMGITTPMFPEENCPQGDCSLLACDPVPDPRCCVVQTASLAADRAPLCQVLGNPSL